MTDTLENKKRTRSMDEAQVAFFEAFQKLLDENLKYIEALKTENRVLEDRFLELGIGEFDSTLIRAFIEKNYEAFQGFLEENDIEGSEAEGVIGKLLKTPAV